MRTVKKTAFFVSAAIVLVVCASAVSAQDTLADRRVAAARDYERCANVTDAGGQLRSNSQAISQGQTRRDHCQDEEKCSRGCRGTYRNRLHGQNLHRRGVECARRFLRVKAREERNAEIRHLHDGPYYPPRNPSGDSASTSTGRVIKNDATKI